MHDPHEFQGPLDLNMASYGPLSSGWPPEAAKPKGITKASGSSTDCIRSPASQISSCQGARSMDHKHQHGLLVASWATAICQGGPSQVGKLPSSAASLVA